MATIDSQPNIPGEPTRAAKLLLVSLFGAQGFYSAMFIAIFTLTTVQGAQLSGDDAKSGWASTLQLLARAAAAYPMGWLLDRVGRRLGLGLGYTLGIVGAGVGVWAMGQQSFGLFLAASALLGLARGAAEQSRYIAAEAFPPSARAGAIGWIVFAGTIGAVLGPKLVQPGLDWATQLGLPAGAGTWLVGMVLAAIAAILVWVAPYQRVAAPLAAATTTDLDAPALLGDALLLPAVRLAIFSMAIAQLVMTLLMVITSLHMSHQHQPTDAIANVILVHTLGMFAFSNGTGWLLKRWGKRFVLLLGAGMLIVVFGLTPFVQTYWLLLLTLFLLGLGWNFAYLASSATLSAAVPQQAAGRVQGVSEVFVALASAAASFGSGYLFDWNGMTAIGLVGLGFAVLLLGLVWLQPAAE